MIIKRSHSRRRVNFHRATLAQYDKDSNAFLRTHEGSDDTLYIYFSKEAEAEKDIFLCDLTEFISRCDCSGNTCTFYYELTVEVEF